MRVLLICLLLTSIIGCSSSKFIPSRDFHLDSNTPIIVEKHPISPDLEAVLLEIGLNVVPNDYILTKSTTEGTEDSNNGTVRYREDKYTSSYVPSRVFIEISGYDSMRFRIIDSETKRLLAVYKYNVDPDYHSIFTRHPLNGFAKELKKHVR